MAVVNTMLTLTAEEVHRNIPYALVCMTRFGSEWQTGRRKRLWHEEFTDEEAERAELLFAQARRWLLVKGVPETVQMEVEDFVLWAKLGKFCASLQEVTRE